MVIVDSSVWIDILRNRETPETVIFERIAAEQEVGLGDLILYEVLQGVKPAERLQKIGRYLMTFRVVPMVGRAAVLDAVRNVQALRAQGVQPATVDCLIATFCIRSGSRLLTSDRHFQPFVEILGLVMAQ